MNDNETVKHIAHINGDYLHPAVSLLSSDTQGVGLAAISSIKKGEVVIRWGGVYVGRREAEAAREKGIGVMQWDEDLFTVDDGTRDRGYFVNHSCDPNLWMDDAYTLSARRDIGPGEELTADYALWEADEEYISGWECRCGSPKCRRRVTGKDWRRADLQREYKGRFSPLMNKRIEKQG